MQSYREPDYDDTVCVTCEAKLPDDPHVDHWAFQGFCHFGCAARFPGSIDLMGAPALALAQATGRLGGPGFERDYIRLWIDAARPDAPAFLKRIGDADQQHRNAPPNSWLWQLVSGGTTHGSRYTAKDNIERHAAQLQLERDRAGRRR